MSSDLARTLHVIAKELHATEQRQIAEQSAAVLYIRQEEEGVDPDEYYNHCSQWEIHKAGDGGVHLSPPKSMIKHNPTGTPPRDHYKFHTYNQAVGDYLAAEFLSHEAYGVGPSGVILLCIRRPGTHNLHSPLCIRCPKEALHTSVHAIIQAYAAGSFV